MEVSQVDEGTLQHTATHCNTLQHNTHCKTLRHLATHSTLQHTATHCNTLQHICNTTHCNIFCNTPDPSWRKCAGAEWPSRLRDHCSTLQHLGNEHCNKLQHIATHSTWHLIPCDGIMLAPNGQVDWECCNKRRHTATHYPPQHTATHCNPLQPTATHCNPLQPTATHCNTPGPIWWSHAGAEWPSKLIKALKKSAP